MKIEQEEHILLEKPADVERRKYVVQGITPGGQMFNVSVGEGREIRVQGSFYSPSEAKDYLKILTRGEARHNLVCKGMKDLRSGAKLIKPSGVELLVTYCRHEVTHHKWTVYNLLTPEEDE